METRSTYHLRWSLTLGLVLLGSVGEARPLVDGDAIQNGNGIEIGVLVERGNTEFASNNNDLAPAVQGLIIHDHNGITARMALGLIIAIGGAIAQSGPKSVESKSYVQGDYLVTETTTTYYSEAEKAQMRDATNSSIDGLFSARYSDFELQVFSKERFGFGDASGFKLNMTAGSGTDHFGVEAGIGFGDVTSFVDRGGMPARIDWKYLGMPFRVTALAGPLRFALTYEWNWLKYGVSKDDRQLHMDVDGNVATRTVSHPFHLEASTMLLSRIAITGGITAQTLSTKVGFTGSLGVYF